MSSSPSSVLLSHFTSQFLYHIQHDTLSSHDNLIKLAMMTSVVYVVFFGLCRMMTSDAKKLSWCITCLNAGVMSVIGICYLSARLYLGDKYFPFGYNVAMQAYRTDNIATFACATFGMATLLDLLLGIVFYPKHIQLLSGWVHHTVFIWLSYFFITGNGFFMTEATPFAPVFGVSLMQEFPTFLLALGSLFPSCRTDLGFGITFFLLRVCLHGYFMIYFFAARPYKIIIIMYLLTMTMHLNWFYGWVKNYNKYSQKSKQVKTQKAA